MPISTGNRSTYFSTGGTTSINWSHNNNGTVLVVGVSAQSSFNGDKFTTANYGGVALTLSTQRFRGTIPAFWGAAIYYTTNPPSGVNTINVSGGAENNIIQHGVGISLSSIDLVSPQAGTTGADSSLITIPSTIHAFNIGVYHSDGGTLATTGTSDILLNASTGNTPSFLGNPAISYQLSESSVNVTMSWGNSTNSLMVGVAFRPVGGDVQEDHQVVWID